MLSVSSSINPYWSKEVIVKTAYSSAMAGLAWGQRAYPEYASAILRIQRMAMLVDTLALASDVYDIGNELYQGVQDPTKTGKKWYYHPLKVSLIFAASVIVLPFITAFVVSYINRYAKPTLDVSALCYELRGLADQIDFKASWGVPKIQRISQWILLNRIVANLVLTAISSKKVFYLVSAFSQMWTLKEISQLHWLRIEKPIQKLITTLKGEQQEVSTLQGHVMLDFFIPPFKAKASSESTCQSLDIHLRLWVKGIYDFMVASWPPSYLKGRWAENQLKNYELSFEPKDIEGCSCKGKSSLDRALGLGVDPKAGVVSIIVSPKTA